MSNHEKLLNTVQNLAKAGVNISLVDLQKVWTISRLNLVNIPGFNLFLKTRSNNRGGGIGFYLKGQ